MSHLADTSVLHRVARSDRIAHRIKDLRSSGNLWTCHVVTLELGFSARSRGEWQRITEAQRALNQAPVDSQVMRRALEVQGEMSSTGSHRVKLPDLIIAAAAETAGVSVLHYDSDFDDIAAVTGQPAEWVLPRGSID